MKINCPSETQERPSAGYYPKRFNYLNPDSQRLISGWFERALQLRGAESECFEAFIFSWFAVNGWAACVTREDIDLAYIRSLQQAPDMREKFIGLLNRDNDFKEVATRFQGFWPIFKAQDIRRARIEVNSHAERRELVKQYLDSGIKHFPECWHYHQEEGEATPLDWPHTLVAIYRVRCNLFTVRNPRTLKWTVPLFNLHFIPSLASFEALKFSSCRHFQYVPY